MFCDYGLKVRIIKENDVEEDDEEWRQSAVVEERDWSWKKGLGVQEECDCGLFRCRCVDQSCGQQGCKSYEQKITKPRRKTKFINYMRCRIVYVGEWVGPVLHESLRHRIALDHNIKL